MTVFLIIITSLHLFTFLPFYFFTFILLSVHFLQLGLELFATQVGCYDCAVGVDKEACRN